MCGIAGFFHTECFSNTNSSVIVKSMAKKLRHRGPDSLGHWTDDGIALSHSRLAVLDLSDSGAQPMFSPSGRYVITFNGEVYNHKNIRADVLKKESSTQWRGGSDTETLCAAIEVFGLNATIKKIEGMFAFAVWDRKEKCLYLCRDRVGEKPLYFGLMTTVNSAACIFASELTALKEHPFFDKDINKSAVYDYFNCGYVPERTSIYQGIQKLTPGHLVKVTRIDLEQRTLKNSNPYWSLEKTIDQRLVKGHHLQYDQLTSDVETRLLYAVEQQMLSDVPLGAFLSGGIDSSLIVALMQEASTQPVKTFSIGFEDKNFDEAIHARQIASHLNTNHHEFYLSERQVLDLVPDIPKIYDEPFADSSQVPTVILSRLAKNYVKVALTGDGGDEIFAGYNRYLAIEGFWKRSQKIPVAFRNLFSSLIQMIPEDFGNNFGASSFLNESYPQLGEKAHKAARIINQRTPEDAYRVLTTLWGRTPLINCELKDSTANKTPAVNPNWALSGAEIMMFCDTLNYLPGDILTKVDRATMSCSLETRAPFLDHKLIELAWQLPLNQKIRNGEGKFLLRNLLSKHVPKNLFERPKMGFGMPIDNWIRDELSDWVESLLDESRLKSQGFLNHEMVRRVWQEHKNGRRNWHHQIWAVLMFQAWYENENNG